MIGPLCRVLLFGNNDCIVATGPEFFSPISQQQQPFNQDNPGEVGHINPRYHHYPPHYL